MDTIAGYGSSSDSEQEPAVSYGAIASFKNKLRVLNSTPIVAERDEVCVPTSRNTKIYISKI